MEISRLAHPISVQVQKAFSSQATSKPTIEDVGRNKPSLCLNEEKPLSEAPITFV